MDTGTSGRQWGGGIQSEGDQSPRTGNSTSGAWGPGQTVRLRMDPPVGLCPLWLQGQWSRATDTDAFLPETFLPELSFHAASCEEPQGPRSSLTLESSSLCSPGMWIRASMDAAPPHPPTPPPPPKEGPLSPLHPERRQSPKESRSGPQVLTWSPVLVQPQDCLQGWLQPSRPEAAFSVSSHQSHQSFSSWCCPSPASSPY